MNTQLWMLTFPTVLFGLACSASAQDRKPDPNVGPRRIQTLMRYAGTQEGEASGPRSRFITSVEPLGKGLEPDAPEVYRLWCFGDWTDTLFELRLGREAKMKVTILKGKKIATWSVKFDDQARKDRFQKWANELFTKPIVFPVTYNSRVSGSSDYILEFLGPGEVYKWSLRPSSRTSEAELSDCISFVDWLITLDR